MTTTAAGPDGDGTPAISVIVTTYNWPLALDLVLDGLARQTFRDFEVLIADDGSGPDTADLIAARAADFPVALRHVWQEDEGFRAARARNRAAAAARGDYLVFLDGDGLVLPTFLANHRKWARPGWFTVGRRCYMRRWASAAILKQGLAPHRWPRAALVPLALFGGSNRPLQLISWPLSETRRKNRPTEWNKAQTCNLGLWRADLQAIGGFEEDFVGYGLEDTDFVIRLIRSGRRRLTLEHADPVLHIWHPRKKIGADNRARLAAMEASEAVLPRVSALRDAAAPAGTTP